MDGHYSHASYDSDNASYNYRHQIYGAEPQYQTPFFNDNLTYPAQNHQELHQNGSIGYNSTHQAPRAQYTYNGYYAHNTATNNLPSSAYSGMPSNNFPPGQQSFSNLPGMGSTTTQLNAHANSIRPVTTVGTTLPSNYHTAFAVSQNQDTASPGFSFDSNTSTHPVHVVGSQGRRGILPADEGRPAAITDNGQPTTKATELPRKDAEGKYPCQHCNKTYLHAKHLKRHMLRHTGARPYSCILCGDNFARSDILKRHFQKCSVRRGNPTGATHLSHSSAHLRRQSTKRATAVLPLSDGNIPSRNVSGTTTPGTSQAGKDENAFAVQSFSMPSSRSNSIRAGDGRWPRDRSQTGPVISSYEQGSYAVFADRGHSDNVDGDVLSQEPSPHDQDATFETNHSASVPDLLSRQSHDWPAFSGGERMDMNYFQQTPFGNVDFSQSRPQTSSGSPTLDTRGVYSQSIPGNPFRNAASHCRRSQMKLPIQQDNWVARKSASIRALATNDGAHPLPGSTELDCALNNIEHLIEEFGTFQTHFQMLHVPSFDVMGSTNGLILSICCVGAVYSSRMQPSSARALIECTKTIMKQKSTVYQLTQQEHVPPEFLMQIDKEVLEEMLALSILYTACLWHGPPALRTEVMADFPGLVRLAKQYQMLTPTPPGSPIWSWMHQSALDFDHYGLTEWNWPSWIYQEKRSRLMYSLLLLDSAMVLYFNQPPQVDPVDEIQLPLPADDAAWQAQNSHEAAMALGLYGPSAQADNSSGTKARRQPNMSYIMHALMYGASELPLNSTNAYSKFILIHALYVQTWKIQRQISLSHNSVESLYLSGEYDASGQSSVTTSGPATPTESSGSRSPAIPRPKRDLFFALKRWKKTWDNDIRIQYPSGVERVGFCRDAEPFYVLTEYSLMKRSESDSTLPSDSKFRHVIHLLKQIKSKSQQQPGGHQSVAKASVIDIQDNYGMTALELDMKMLFVPVDQELD